MLNNLRASAVVVLAVGTASMLVSPADAQQYRRRGGGDGAGIAAGVIGGLAAGALVGGALAPRGAYAAPGPVEDGYDADGYEGCPAVREPVYDGAGRFAGYRVVPGC